MYLIEIQAINTKSWYLEGTRYRVIIKNNKLPLYMNSTWPRARFTLVIIESVSGAKLIFYAY